MPSDNVQRASIAENNEQTENEKSVKERHVKPIYGRKRPQSYRWNTRPTDRDRRRKLPPTTTKNKEMLATPTDAHKLVDGA